MELYVNQSLFPFHTSNMLSSLKTYYLQSLEVKSLTLLLWSSRIFIARHYVEFSPFSLGNVLNYRSSQLFSVLFSDR